MVDLHFQHRNARSGFLLPAATNSSATHCRPPTRDTAADDLRIRVLTSGGYRTGRTGQPSPGGLDGQAYRLCSSGFLRGTDVLAGTDGRLGVLDPSGLAAGVRVQL